VAVAALSAEDHLVREDEEESLPGVAERCCWPGGRVCRPLGVSIAVMELVAMLSPAVVHRDLLHSAGQAGTMLGGGRRVGASMVDQALERLNERSLLGFSLDGQAVSVHRLAAQVIRAGMSRQGRLVSACRAAASAVEGPPRRSRRPGSRGGRGKPAGSGAGGKRGNGTDDANEQVLTC
jgi:hypothetical protein